MAASLLVAVPAVAAGQVTSRKSIVSSSAGAATAVSYDTFFTAATTNASIKSIRLQFCDAATGPLYNTTCTLPTGFVRGTTIATQTVGGSAFGQSYTAATNGTTDVLLTNATGNAINSGQQVELKLTGFTNPTTVNVQYYVRVVTCNDTTCTVGTGSNIDFGGIALATTQTVAVSASVQENLIFCTGVSGANCAAMTASGAALTLSPNPLTTASTSTGTSVFYAATNASSGYAVQYTSTQFTATGGDTYAYSGACSNFAAGGVAQFGLRIPNASAISGPGSGITTGNAADCTTGATYYTQAAGPTTIATAAGATDFDIYTVTYGANVAATTKPGAYSASLTYICTGTF